MNTKEQSNVGLGQAIAYFTGVGYAVSIPLTESQRYDLVVDDGVKLYRVEVKTTKQLNSQLCLVTSGGNQSWTGAVKRISEDECDLVFCYSLVTSSGYLFPVEVLAGRSTINLGSKYEAYKVL